MKYPNKTFAKISVFCSSPDFVPSLRRLFKNTIFTLMILTYLVSVNGFIGMITFKPKFLEQVYGQSASKAIFLIGTEQKLTLIPSAHCSLLPKATETMMLLKGSVNARDKVDLNCKR